MVAELCGWNPRTTSCPVVDLVSREWSPLRITVPHITQASVGTERIAVCARKAWLRSNAKCSQRYNVSELQEKQEKRTPQENCPVWTRWSWSSCCFEAGAEDCRWSFGARSWGWGRCWGSRRRDETANFRWRDVRHDATPLRGSSLCVVRLKKWDTGKIAEVESRRDAVERTRPISTLVGSGSTCTTWRSASPPLASRTESSLCQFLTSALSETRLLHRDIHSFPGSVPKQGGRTTEMPTWQVSSRPWEHWRCRALTRFPRSAKSLMTSHVKEEQDNAQSPLKCISNVGIKRKFPCCAPAIDQGNLMSVTAQKHRLGLYLRSKDKPFLRSVTQESVITNSIQLTQKESADSYKDNYGAKKLELREAHQQVLTEMEELRKFQSCTFDTIARWKLIEGQNTILELSGRLQELQNEVNCMNDSKDFSACWISSQWKFPRYLSTSVIPTSSNTWRTVEASLRIAVPQRRAAKHLGHTWYIGKRFCKSTCIFISSLSSRIESMEYVNRGAAPYVYSGEKWKTRTRPRSEMPVWSVSQRFSHLQWRRLFQELWSRPTTIADFGSSL